MIASIVGTLNRKQRRDLVGAAARANAKLLFANCAKDAMRSLPRLKQTPVCVFATDAGDAETLVQWLSDHHQLSAVPVVLLLDRPSDVMHRRAFEMGVDDVLASSDVGGVTRRLANLELYEPGARPTADKGTALVGAKDPMQRRRVGLSLRKAGYEVAFAQAGQELVEAARVSSPSLVVTTPSFPPVHCEVGRDATRAPGALRPATMTLPQLHDSEAPRQDIDRLMLEIDEHLRGDLEARNSRRAILSTLCTFRRTDTLETTYGMTHNISESGLYVRTLDPPAMGRQVCIEIRTFDGKVIHVRGHVAWRRLPSNAAATGPSGFGLKISDEHTSRVDRDDFRQLHDRAVADNADSGRRCSH